MTNHKLDTNKQVFFYEQEFYVLSNFSAFSIRWLGRNFPTTEHAYHYRKFDPQREDMFERLEAKSVAREEVFKATSAHNAFKIADYYKDIKDPHWDAVKVDIMKKILWEKVRQHEYVYRKLLETGDRELIEDSWRDGFWGWGVGHDGQNMLGKLWMSIREEIQYGSIIR